MNTTDKSPTLIQQSLYLAQVANKEKISITKARNKYKSFTIEQFKKLLNN